MAIGPIETNGAIGRMQDISILRQNEENKTLIDQGNYQNIFQKEIKDKSAQVNQADNANYEKENYDAKEKGNGQYYSNQKQKKKNEQKKDKVVY